MGEHIVMQVMVELQDGITYPLEEFSIIGYDPLVIILIDKSGYRATVRKARRFFMRGNK